MLDHRVIENFIGYFLYFKIINIKVSFKIQAFKYNTLLYTTNLLFLFKLISMICVIIYFEAANIKLFIFKIKIASFIIFS